MRTEISTRPGFVELTSTLGAIDLTPTDAETLLDQLTELANLNHDARRDLLDTGTPEIPAYANRRADPARIAHRIQLNCHLHDTPGISLIAVYTNLTYGEPARRVACVIDDTDLSGFLLTLLVTIATLTPTTPTGALAAV